MLRPAEAAATGQTPLPLRRPASEKSLCRNTVHVLQGDKVRVPCFSGACGLVLATVWHTWGVPVSVRSV